MFVPVIYVSEKRSHVYLVVDAMERFPEEHDVALTAMREAWVRVDTIYVTMGAAGKIYSTAPFYKNKIDFKRTKTDCMS